MPPPKKLKTGSTRVDAFLTSNEIADLKRDLVTKLPLMWAGGVSGGAAEGGGDAWSDGGAADQAEDLSMWSAKSRGGGGGGGQTAGGCPSRLLKAFMCGPLLADGGEARQATSRQTLLTSLLRDLPVGAAAGVTDRATANRWQFDSEPAISKLSALMVEPAAAPVAPAGAFGRDVSEAAVSLVMRRSPGGKPLAGQWDGRTGALHACPHPATPGCTDSSRSRLQWMLTARRQTGRADAGRNSYDAGRLAGGSADAGRNSYDAARLAGGSVDAGRNSYDAARLAGGSADAGRNSYDAARLAGGSVDVGRNSYDAARPAGRSDVADRCSPKFIRQAAMDVLKCAPKVIVDGQPQKGSSGGGCATPQPAPVIIKPMVFAMDSTVNVSNADEMKFSQLPPGVPPDLASLGGSRQGSPLDQLDRLSDSSYELPSSTMDEPSKAAPEQPTTPKDGRQCQICSDTASGFHYGVWSCEGCKAFFKRSLQGPVDYVCPATNNCKIDKFRRKSCQACRLRKCLEMGMSKGNCRKEKGSRGQKGTAKRRSDLLDMDGLDMKKNKLIKDEAYQHATAAFALSALHASPPCGGGLADSSHALPPLPADPHPPMHPLVAHLLQIDPPVRMSGHDNSQPDSERHLVVSIVKLADLELVDIINWAKAFPGYADFEMKDRVHLLEVCWTEVIVCGLIWRSMGHAHSRTLVLAPDLHLDRERCHISRLWPICDSLLALCNCFHRLSINREEFVLLRALVLLNAEVGLQDGDDKWHSLRRRVTDALDYTACARHDPTCDPVTSRDRLTRMLLLLPHVRAAATELFGWLRRAKDDHAGPFCELLREMIDVRSTAASTRSAFDR